MKKNLHDRSLDDPGTHALQPPQFMLLSAEGGTMHEHEMPHPTHVLDRLLDPVGRCLSSQADRELAGLRDDEEA
jgi:hypothetical protein